jgi:hypothetical protein
LAPGLTKDSLPISIRSANKLSASALDFFSGTVIIRSSGFCGIDFSVILAEGTLTAFFGAIIALTS